MNGDAKKAAESLLEEAFIALMPIADQYGITIKRMAELLPAAQIQKMREQGCSQQDIMAASGYTLKTIRKILASEPLADDYNRIERFVGDWMTDPSFPPDLPVSGPEFPSFSDVAARYGKEFTPGGLLKILLEQALVEVKGGAVILKGRAVILQSAPKKLESARIAIRDFIGTLAHNIAGHEKPYLERRVWSYRIPPRLLPAVREKIEARILAYREKIIEILADAEDAPAVPDNDETDGVGLGIYWFERK